MGPKEKYDDKIGHSEFILPSHTVNNAIVGSEQSVGQRLEWLKSDVSFLKDHIKALRAMSVVSVDFEIQTFISKALIRPNLNLTKVKLICRHLLSNVT